MTNACNKEFLFMVKPILTLMQDKCICTLITVGEYNLLFDCGWNERFTPNIKKKYEEKLKDIKLDAIFLSNNYINYFGALPLIKSFPKNDETKIYATTPIANLGVYVMMDAYISNLESQENALSHFTISQEDLCKTFYNINKINFLQSIILNKNLNNNINEDILTIISIPSGTSMGGAAWTCNYRLFNFVYASEFSIEPKIIADPFPYKKLKKINYFITDNKFQKEVPIIRKVIDEDFDKKIRECFEKKKTIFIPSDNINSMIEMITKFEKLLDEYKETYSNKMDKAEYKILVCSNCSNEIIEGVKSLTEFLGTKISQQFCSFGEKPFNFEDVICIKNLEEFTKEINNKMTKYIILATFENLNIGLGYSILPYLLNDKNLIMINIFKEFELQSVFGNIIKEVKNLKSNIFPYKEKKVVERKKSEKNNKKSDKMEIESEKSDEEEKNDESQNENNNKNIDGNKTKNNNNIINNSSYKMVLEKGKLFNLQKNNNGYLSFNFDNRIKYTDYGIELSNEEIEIMKKNNVSENSTYNSNFLNFKKEQENTDKKEINIDLTEFCLPTKIDIIDTKIEIKCEILFYPLINHIDIMSKKFIIEEIKPKDGIILIGYTNALSDELKSNNLNCYNLTNNDTDKFEKTIVNDIVQFNYTSDDLHSGKKVIIEKGNESIYSFDSLLLSIKTKRNDLVDISIVNNKYKKIGEMQGDKIKTVNDEKKTNKIFTKNNLKLINIKHQIEDNSNIKLIILDHKLRTLDKSVEIYIKDGDLVLDGEFNEQYFNIKSKINNIFFNYDNENK